MFYSGKQGIFAELSKRPIPHSRDGRFIIRQHGRSTSEAARRPGARSLKKPRAHRPERRWLEAGLRRYSGGFAAMAPAPPRYRGHMQQARRTAGSFFASLGGALGLSLLAHAGALTALLWDMRPAAAPSAARHKGAIVVTLATPSVRRAGAATQASVATASRTDKAPAAPPGRTPRQDAAPPAASPAALPLPAPAIASEAPSGIPTPEAPPGEAGTAATSSPVDIPSAQTKDASSARDATANPSPAAQPGARFATLFAPVIARPMGRGRWRAPPERLPPPDALAQREQALAGLRQALSARLAQMQASLLDTPLQGRCDIRIDPAGRRAHMLCTAASDEPRLWSLLDGLLVAGPVGHAAEPVCIEARSHRIEWRDCAATAGAPPA